MDHSRAKFINPAFSGGETFLQLDNLIQLTVVRLFPNTSEFLPDTDRKSAPLIILLLVEWALLYCRFLLVGLFPNSLFPMACPVRYGVKDDIGVGDTFSERFVIFRGRVFLVREATSSRSFVITSLFTHPHGFFVLILISLRTSRPLVPFFDHL